VRNRLIQALYSISYTALEPGVTFELSAHRQVFAILKRCEALEVDAGVSNLAVLYDGR
jgi:hypothetical protein